MSDGQNRMPTFNQLSVKDYSLRFSCVPFLEMCTSWLLQFNISNKMEMSEGICFIAVF